LAQQYPHRVVDIEHLHGDNPGTRLSHEQRTVPLKMARPRLTPRVKEGDDFPLKESGEVCAFRGVALRTCQAKVLRVVAAAVLPRNDVLNVKRQEVGIVLMNPTVLASAFGAAPYKRASRGVNHRSSTDVLLDDWASILLAFDLSTATKVENET